MKSYHLSIKVALVTLLAPAAWGTTYITVTELLPADRPLFVAAMRVLPAGIVLAAFSAARWRPTGRQWGHTALLALFNFGIFFPLLIVGVYRLPGGVAASVGGVQPLLVALVTWALGGSTPRRRDLLIGATAALGVALVVVRPGAAIDPVGVIAALGANVSFSIGVVLTKRLPAPEDRIGSTGWQLLMGAMMLVPLALATEGVPASITSTNLVGFAYLSLVATGLAFAVWFNGVRRLPTQAPPLLGLAAPLTGAALGWLVLSESLSATQLVGFAITVSAIVYGATAATAAPSVHAMRVPARPGPIATIATIPPGWSVDDVATEREFDREVAGITRH